jgi:hypothetical protein
MVAGAARAYVDSTPEVTHHREWGLRHALSQGAFGNALASVSSRERAAPRDKLLRSLYDGLVAYYAGDYVRSGASLRAADQLADERYTRSVSRGALAMVSNDLVLPYMPGHTERLLVPYYGALGYLQRGDRDGAAVEARLLSSLLQRFEDEQDSADVSTRALLRYFAGAVFEAAGEGNDAEVAYRNARELAPESIPRSAGVPNGAGEVIVVIERGFVANRVEEALHIEIDEDQRDSLAEHSKKRRVPNQPGFSELLRQLDESEQRGVYRRSSGRRLGRGHHRGYDDDPGYVLKVAWPVYEPPMRGQPPVVLAATSAQAGPAQRQEQSERKVPFTLAGEISEGIIADYRRQRVALLTRTVLRAAAKYAAAEAAEEKKGKGGKILAGITGALLEHADTRSWHLLPSDISIARISLPAGRHRLSVRTASGSLADSVRAIDLGEIDIAAGAIAFVTKRLWPDLTASATVSRRN